MKHTTHVFKPDVSTVEKSVDFAVLTVYGLPTSLLFVGALIGSLLGRIVVGGPVFWSALIGCSLYALAFWAIQRATANRK